MSNLLLYVITVVIWGSTWLAIEFQLGVIAPEVSIVYRYSTAAVLLFLWCHLRGLSLRFDLRAHGWFVLLGLTLFCLNYILTYRAQIHITSALSAIVFSSLVWMNILLAKFFFGVKAGRSVQGGAVLGICGIVVLFAPQIGELSFSDSILFGSVLSGTGALVASFGNMVSQKAQSLKLPVVQSNAWGMFYGAMLTAIYTVSQGHAFAFDLSPGYVISLAYLSVFGSIIAFGAYLTLLGRIGAHKAGYAMVMFPVVALLLSMLFEGLRIDASIVVGTFLVLAGNIAVLKGAPRKKPLQPVVAPAE
ncbi:MAG: EamA family transporter [Woeseiaceae bacterium]|nr:EamA family transporter [Woeseiaceae bacterium]